MVRRIIATALVVSTTLAIYVALAPVVADSRSEKISIYREFLKQWEPNQPGLAPVQLVNVTRRFDPPILAVTDCAPTSLATTAVSRWFKTLTFTADDLRDLSVRLVDRSQQEEIRRELNSEAYWEGGSVQGRANADLSRGLLEVSDIGFDLTGRHAVLTYSFSCGGYCSQNHTVLFGKIGGKWVPSDKYCGPVRFH